MANQTFFPQSIAWGRLPDGRFFLNLDMQVTASNGQIVRVPVTTFLLTKDEEERLKVSLIGLHIVTNGQRLG